MKLVIEKDIVEWLKGEGSILCLARDVSHSFHWKMQFGDDWKTECEWDDYQLQIPLDSAGQEHGFYTYHAGTLHNPEKRDLQHIKEQLENIKAQYTETVFEEIEYEI